MHWMRVASLLSYFCWLGHVHCQSSSQQGSSVALSSTAATICASNTPSPIAIPLRNVTLRDETLRRGLPLSYGTPPQPLSMQVTCNDNNTYIVDESAPCDSGDSRISCYAKYGGQFDQGSSSTFAPYNNLTAPGLCPVGNRDFQMNDISGTDVLTISPTTNVTGYPTGIFRGGHDFGSGPGSSTLGLSFNSTLLRTLVASGTIASHAFGLFYGWVGANTQSQKDGSLVLGGYDQAKVTGPNTTYPIYYGKCASGLTVSLEDITMNLQNGSNLSIMPPSNSQTFQACIDPAEVAITVNSYMWSAFTNISGNIETGRSMGTLNFWTMLVEASSAYTGDLTLTIGTDAKNRMQVRIPNHQIVVPDYAIDSSGQTYSKNISNADTLLLSLQDVNANDLIRLGRPFLSSAYLFVNYDQDNFMLWQSQPATETTLVAVDSRNCDRTPPTVAVPVDPSPTPSPSPTSSSVSLSKGTISGISIGGLAFAITVFSLTCILYRRVRNQRLTQAPNRKEKTKEEELDPKRSFISSEISTLGHAPQEVPDQPEASYYLAPCELATYERTHELPETL